MHRFIQRTALLLMAAVLAAVPLSAGAEQLNEYVDRSDPVITVSGTKLDGSRLTVTGTAFDSWSGISTVKASADGNDFEPVQDFETGEGGAWTYTYAVPEDCGRYGRFVFRAVDNAGNSAEISRNDIEIYNKTASLIFPDYVVKNIPVRPEIEGEPVRAVVNVSGHGYDHEEWELEGPDFTLVWDGFIAGIEVPAGNYLLTVRTYNQTGQFTVSNTQAIVPGSGDDNSGAGVRYIDTSISGTVESIGDDGAVVSGQDLDITDDSRIDDGIRPGDKVTGIGRYDTVTGQTEIRILKKTDEPARSLPDIEIDGDEKTGEKEFAGIIEAAGADYIVVEGEVIYVTGNTVISCDFSELQPGDYVSGTAEVFSRSGTKALIINKAETEKAVIETVAGHVTASGDGWVEIDTGSGRYMITDSTVVNGEYEIGTMILIEALLPEHEVLKITVLRHAECTEGLSYYYGKVNGIFRVTGELVIGELIHTIDETLTVDDLAGSLEKDAISAAVDYECRTVSLRVVQNAGDPREQDRIAGMITSVGQPDVNGNTPVYIDGKYHFVSRNTDMTEQPAADTAVTAVQTGDELLSVYEIPDASIDADDLTDFAGTVARVSGMDSYGRSYILVDGITYRLMPDITVSESAGRLEKGAVIAGSVIGNDIVHAAVIRGRSDGINPDNAFMGTVSADAQQAGSGYQVFIDGQRYSADKSSLVYADLTEGSLITAVADDGFLLAARDYPENFLEGIPRSVYAVISSVSAKDYQGNFTVTADGYEYSVSAETLQSGYIAAGMNCVITFIEYEDGNRETVAVAAGSYSGEGRSLRTLDGKVGYISLPDETGSGTMLIGGIPVKYTAASDVSDLSEDDFVIAAVQDGTVITAAVREETVFGKPESFSGIIEAVGDMQPDGSCIVTVGGSEIVLGPDTLFNDAEAPLEPDTVITGIRFGDTVWIAATSGIGRWETSDAAFSGIVERVDMENHTLTVRGRVRNAGDADLSSFVPGMIAAGAMRPGRAAVSVQAVNPERTLDDIESFAGTAETVTATDRDGIRRLGVNGDVYFITDAANVSGNLKDGSRIAGFADSRTREVLSLTVAEAEDLGGYLEGKIEEITSEKISVPEKKDWYHLVLGGMYDLVGDRTVLISEELKVKDKISGYYFGPERKLLAVLEEDTSLIGKIRNASVAVKIGMGALGLAIAGSGAALGIGGKKKKFEGILELESDSTILVTDPDDPEKVKRFSLPENLRETAALMNHRHISGYTRFGKVEKLDIAE